MPSHRNFIRTCLSQKSFCFIYGAHKYQALATCNSPMRGSSGDRYLSRADVDADAIQYEGGCRSCAWPTDPLSRASACATLCHGNAKLEYTTRASIFVVSAEATAASRFRLKMHDSTLQLRKWPRRPTRSWINVDSLRDYGKGSRIRQRAFLRKKFFFQIKKEISGKCLIKYVNSKSQMCIIWTLSDPISILTLF